MQTILVALLATSVVADVSHIINQPDYQYKAAIPENNPLSSYGVPQSSILGNGAPSITYSATGSADLSQYSFPSASGPSINFLSGPASSLSNGFSVPSYSDFANSVPTGFSNVQVSTPAPSVGLSSVVPTSAYQSNILQYSQTPNSYQFLSSLNQPSVPIGVSVNTFGISDGSPARIASDASLNSGVGINSNAESGVQQESSVSTQSSGGDINDAFGISSGDNVQDPEVTKKLYFFAAPEDEEEEQEIQAKIDLPSVPPKQTYKIIFIKAPTYRNKATITVPAPAQNQERTLVYVLVRKPDIRPTVRFQPSGDSTEAPKPEVFFIKYRTQQEAEAAVAEIQSKHGASGQIISNLQVGSRSNFESNQDTNVVSSTTAATPVNVEASGVSVSNDYNNVESSTAFSASVDSRIAENINRQVSGESQQENGFVHNAETPFKFSIDRTAPLSVTPVTFGQQSVDSLSVFGGGVAAIRNEQNVGSSNLSGLAAGITQSGPDYQQVETGANIPVDTAEDTTTRQFSENFIEQRVGESNNQDPQVAGFSSYGPPNYKK